MGQDTAKKGDRGEGLRTADPGEAAGEAPAGEVRESGVYESRRPPPDAAGQDELPCTCAADVEARYRRLVWMLIRKARVPEHTAEDVFQEVFKIMNQYIEAKGMPPNPGTTLGSITWKHIGNYRRAEARTRRQYESQAEPGESAALPPSQTNPEQLYSQREQWDLVNAAFARLPEAAARVLKVCDLEENTDEEAAAILACTKEQLRSRHHRARLALRALVERLTRRRGGAK